jgi:drug/metabolite transporter (DMT)-like permease
MAAGWDPGTGSLRALTANRWLLMVLLLAGPWLLWRPRADPRRGAALCVVVSGVVGIVASYYGDATELRRHCYGPGQQVLLGLVIGALVAIDRVRLRRASAGEVRSDDGSAASADRGAGASADSAGVAFRPGAARAPAGAWRAAGCRRPIRPARG